MPDQTDSPEPDDVPSDTTDGSADPGDAPATTDAADEAAAAGAGAAGAASGAAAAGAVGDAPADGPDAPPADPATPPVIVPPPPTTAAAGAEEAASTAWPTSAKVWVGVLAVVALLLGIATAVGFSQASSSDDDKAAAEDELDAAEARAASAEQERDEVAEALGESQAEVESLTNALAATTSELEEAQAENEVLAAAVETERARAEAAEAELADTQAQIEAIFPITVDTSLVGLDLAGTYTISFEEKYCDFVTGCGTTPNANQAIIGVTPENFLDITIPGILQGGLFSVNGGLYAITDSETAIPPCGDVPRRGRVTITIWPSSIEVGEDGVAFPTALEASITLDAPTIDECPSGLVFWGAKLTPSS